MATTTTGRPGDRICNVCGQPLNYSRFRVVESRWRRGARDSDPNHASTIGSRDSDPNHGRVTRFSPTCRACEQKKRNERKNDDRPAAIIRARARTRAARLGVPLEFMWSDMNWRALVPVFRAMLTPEGICLNCGHPFQNERDIQIDHIEPPRHDHDWAREHARNIAIRCQSCNCAKSAKPFPVYLDEQEHARVSNNVDRDARAQTAATAQATSPSPPLDDDGQLRFWE